MPIIPLSTRVRSGGSCAANPVLDAKVVGPNQEEDIKEARIHRYPSRAIRLQEASEARQGLDALPLVSGGDPRVELPAGLAGCGPRERLLREHPHTTEESALCGGQLAPALLLQIAQSRSHELLEL